MMFLIFTIISLLTCVILIFMDIFLVSIPLGLVIFVVLMSIIFWLYYQRHHKTKIWLTIISNVLVFLIICFTCIASIFNPYWNSVSFKDSLSPRLIEETVSYRDFIADLNFVYNKVKETHPAFIHDVPIIFDEKYKEIVNNLNANQEYSVKEVYQVTRRLLSSLEDAHTSAYIRYEHPHYIYDYLVIKDQGYRLTMVNNMSITSIFEQHQDLFSYEVESHALNNLKGMLLSQEDLTVLGYDLTNDITMIYENEEDKQLIRTYTIDDFVFYEDMEKVEKKEDNKNEKNFVYYEVDESLSLGMLTLSMCRYNDEYKKVVHDFFEEVAAKDLQYVSVDLRNNPGGSSMVVNEFIKYLPCDTYETDSYYWRLGPVIMPFTNKTNENKRYENLVFSGDVYLLTNAGTFSSAMMFAEYIGDNDLGKIIGEPPANAATGYGEVVNFQLPKSKILLSVSSKRFVRPDESTSEILVIPDIICDSKDVMDVLFSEIEK